MTFHSLSAWGQAEAARRVQQQATREDVDAIVDKVAEDIDRKRIAALVDGPRFDHWHHDLQTVDILLDQHPPDIERARHLIDDLSREIYQEMR